MAVAVSGALIIEQWASKDFEYSDSVFVENQAALYFHSAIKAAQMLLRDDKNDFDSKNDDWVKLPALRSGNAVILINIVPLNEKININLLNSTDKALKNRVYNAVKTIFNDNDENTNDINYIKEWFEYKNGYTEYDKGYRPTGENFYSLKELDYVKNLNYFSAKFHKFFTIDDFSGKLNINFASAEIIKAYLPEIASCAGDIMKYRAKKPFSNITQLRNVGCINDKDYLKILPFITTKSNFFGLYIDVDINGVHRYAAALMSRNSGGVRIVKYFEGRGFYE